MIQDCFRPLPPDRPVLWDAAGGWHSGGDLERAINRIRPLFGGSPRPLVFLYCRNDVATVTTYLAAVRAGAVVALLDPARPGEQATELRARYRPDWLAGALPEGHGGDIAGYAPYPAEGPYRTEGPPLLRRCEPAGGLAPHPDLCLLLATSGSTGSPKFVRLSRRAVTSNAAAIAQSLSLTAEERPLGHLALHYSYGLSVLNSHLAVGASVVLCEHGLTGRDGWEICRAQDCTSLAGVPAHYELLRRLDLARLALPRLRTLTQAGGKLAPELVLACHARITALGGRLYVMYGQTEAAPRMACLAPDRVAAKPGSVGRALPGGAFRIHRADGDDASPGEPGEIIYHGPNVMMGYAEERNHLARGDLLGGVLPTGDMGYLDAEGDLFITGRLARFAKLYGLRVSLDDIEARLAPSLGRVAAVERDGKVVVHACAAIAPATFRAALRRLGLPANAVSLRVIDALPQTASGKTDYKSLPG